MSSPNYKERLIDICDRFIKWFKWDLEKMEADAQKAGSRSISRDEELMTAVYKAKSEAEAYYGRGIASLYDRIDGAKNGYGNAFSDHIRFPGVKNFRKLQIERLSIYQHIILDLIQLYTDWEQNDFSELMKYIGQNDFFKEKKFKLHPSVLEAINELVFDGRFTTYKYKDTGEVLRSTDKFFISPEIGISNDLSMWLTHLQMQTDFLKNQEKDNVYVTLFGKLNEIHPIYSSWIITLHKGDTIWLVTDQMDFDNPFQMRQRLGRKSVWQEANDLYDSCDFPYEIFHELDKLRAKQKGLAKTDSFIRHKVKFYNEFDKYWRIDDEDRPDHTEVFKAELDKINVKYDIAYAEYTNHNSLRNMPEEMFAKKQGIIVAYWKAPQSSRKTDEIIVYLRPEVLFQQFDTLNDSQKGFIVMLTHEVISYVEMQNTELETVMISKEFIEMKLLEGAKYDPNDKSKMEYWSEECQSQFRDLMETLEDDGKQKTTALALRGYELVHFAEKYDANWLTTVDKQQSLAEWHILTGETDHIYPKIRELKNTADDAYKWLIETMNKNYSAIRDKIFEYKELEFQGLTWGTFDTDPDFSEIGHVVDHKFETKSNRGYGDGIGKTYHYNKPEMCFECKKFESKKVKIIHIRHYKVLMWLLDIKHRSTLPRYYQNYRAHNLIPYTGNSLLDQTHPYLNIIESDPCSEAKTNGMSIRFFMCGHCLKKYKSDKEKHIIKLYDENEKRVMRDQSDDE